MYVCGWVGGWRGGATLFLTYNRGGLELIFFCLGGGGYCLSFC